MRYFSRLIVGALTLTALAACGRKEEAAPAAASSDAPAAPAPASESTSVAAVAEEKPTPGWPSADQERAQVQALLQQVGSAPNAVERRAELQRRLDQIDRYGTQPESLNLPPEWRETNRVVKGGAEADLMAQVGDIDNLGFGWPEGFDPFSGKSTPAHSYPWRPEADDPDGTDRVMVISGLKQFDSANRDGYTEGTSRPHNTPRPVVLKFPVEGLEIKSAALQLFVDDFQAPVFGNRFTVSLDGQSAPDLAATINRLQQTGPIGKLVTLQLLPEYLNLLRDGKLTVLADDADTNAGDGFAFDFVRVLINPKPWKYAGTVRGVAVEAGSAAPLAGVLVSAANVKQVETKADGKFELTGVPAGLVVTSGSHPNYIGDAEQADLEAGQSVDIVLELEKSRNTSDALAQQLEVEGKVDLYGIYFDLDKATLKPESEATLEQVRELLANRPTLRVVIGGHTDSEGSDEYNRGLSERRAAAVVTWLTAHEIRAERLRSEGLGETQPVADNASPAGRALNRRVEIRDARR